MSTIIVSIILLIIVFIGIRSIVKRAAHGCCGGGDSVKKVKIDKNISHYDYKYMMNIEGMSCNHCKNTVENALNSLGGIYAKVDLENRNAVIYSKKECDINGLRACVNSHGFTASEPVLCND